MPGPNVIIVGASNLVSKKKQPLISCNCYSQCTRKEEHLTSIPATASFRIVAQRGAKFFHKKEFKDVYYLFEQALSQSPKTIVLYMDCVMNSLTVPPFAKNRKTYQPSKPEDVLKILKEMKERANAKDVQFVVVLSRRRSDTEAKTEENQKKHVDNTMNRLIKDNHLQYFDLKLSKSSFKEGDPAHQTQLSINLSLGRIIRYFNQES